MTTNTATPPPAAAPLPRSAWTHPAARPFVTMGTIAVVGGGLLSAALAPSSSYHSSWAVAYIVLVAGVAQVVLGVAQTATTAGHLRSGVIIAQALLWNVGAAATVTATILDVAPLLYAAAAAQIAALVLFLHATRFGAHGPTLATVRIVCVLLLVSVPTGIVLQAITH